MNIISMGTGPASKIVCVNGASKTTESGPRPVPVVFAPQLGQCKRGIRPTAMCSSSLDKRSPSDDTGMALSQALDYFELAAKSRALD